MKAVFVTAIIAGAGFLLVAAYELFVAVESPQIRAHVLELWLEGRKEVTEENKARIKRLEDLHLTCKEKCK